MSSMVIAVFNGKPSGTIYTIFLHVSHLVFFCSQHSNELKSKRDQIRIDLRPFYESLGLSQDACSLLVITEPNKGLEASCLKSLWMEHRGFEPLTSTMRTLRATNCANAPKFNLIFVQFLQIVSSLLPDSRALYQLVISQSADKV